MNGLKRVLRDEPTLIIEAFRLTLLAVVGLGLGLSVEQTTGIVIAFSAMLAVANRAVVTPTAKVDKKIDTAVETALTAEPMTAASPAMTAEQQQLVDDLRATIDMLRAERLKA